MSFRLLLDEGISREVARQLSVQGHTVEPVLDLELRAKPDPFVFQEAQRRQPALVTRNRVDFELLVTAWVTWGWGLGSHHGMITPRRGR